MRAFDDKSCQSESRISIVFRGIQVQRSWMVGKLEAHFDVLSQRLTSEALFPWLHDGFQRTKLIGDSHILADILRLSPNTPS